MITVSALNEHIGIRHAFFSRDGGVSEGIYASLNCGPGSKDDPEKVRRNRAIAMEYLDMPPEALVTLRQEHTSKTLIVTEPFAPGDLPAADALATNVPGLALGVLAADCAPVLLADPKAGVIGAAHAGWRGALGGVLKSVVEAMESLGAKRENMTAAVGPCIAQRSYQVSADFAPPFLAEDELNKSFFAPCQHSADKLLFDLPGYCARRLAVLGLVDVVRTPCDTFAQEERFFSFRRSVQRGEPDYGRQLSAIVIER